MADGKLTAWSFRPDISSTPRAPVIDSYTFR
jgi:hypothetical protein